MNQIRICAAGVLLSALIVTTSSALAQTQMGRLAQGMVPGMWAELATENLEAIVNAGETGLGQGPFSIFNYAEGGGWYPPTQQFFFIGGGHVSAKKFVVYSAETNAWTQLPDPGWFPPDPRTNHGFDHTAINIAAGEIFHHPFRDQFPTIYRYSIEQGTWSELPANPGYVDCCRGLEFFPERNGLVEAVTGQVHFFDDGADEWSTEAMNLPMGPFENFAEYNPVHGVMLFGGGRGDRQIHLMSPDGTITAGAEAPVGLGVDRSVVTVDPVSGDYLVLAGAAGSMALYAYDVLADSWRVVDDNPPMTTEYGDAFDVIATPVSTYGVTMFVNSHTIASQAQVWLYRHAQPARNTTPPTVSLSAPSSSSTVSGTAAITANASDDVGVASVQFLVNGVNLGAADIVAPYAAAWNTLALADGDYVLTARATDLSGNSAISAAVMVTVNNFVNTPPTANNDSAVTDENTSVTIDLLGNDSDPDGDVLSIESVTQGSAGSVAIGSGGSVVYTPNTGFDGNDVFTYTASDAMGGTDTASVSVAVRAVNDSPTVNDDAAATDEDISVTIDVLANDSDPDGTALTVQSVSPAANGTPSIDPAGTITYTPNLNFNGVDTFTYTARDAGGVTGTATVTVTVASVNDRPVATRDVADTDEDVAVVIDVLANDSDADGDVLRVVGIIRAPANGTAVVNAAGTITYTPNPDFNGTDDFNYRLTDGFGDDRFPRVDVTVRPVNDAPTINADVVSTNEDVAIDIDVLANDTDPDAGDVISIVNLPGEPPRNGVAVVNATGTITYTPNANFNGVDTFWYRARDIVGGAGGFGVNTVTVTVLPVDDAPVAGDDRIGTDEDTAVAVDVLGNDSDADGDPLSVTAVTQGSNGSVAIASDGSVVYTPAPGFSGSDAFTYTVSDAGSGTDTATVSITVAEVNEAPVANAQAVSIGSGDPVEIVLSGSDADADPLTYSVVDLPANGTLSSTSGQVLSYIADAGYAGPDSFTFVVNDGLEDSGIATVEILVEQLTQLGQLAQSMAPGAWAELSTENLDAIVRTAPSSSRNGRSIFNSADGGAWDPTTEQFFFIGGGYRVAKKFVAYSAATNAWTQLPDPAWFPAEGMTLYGADHTAINVAAGELYHHPFGSRAQTTYRYNIDAGTWSALPANPGYVDCCRGVEFFPEMNGLVEAVSGIVHLFDDATNDWSMLDIGLPMGPYKNFAEYNPVNGVMLFGGGRGNQEIHVLSADGTITPGTESPVPLGVDDAVVTLDPVSGDYLVLGFDGSDLVLYAYDALADSWRLVDDALPLSTEYGDAFDVVATPISNYGVTMFVNSFSDSTLGTVWLYRHAPGSP